MILWRTFLIGLLIGGLIGCRFKKESTVSTSDSAVSLVGSLKKIMWDGELYSKIYLDTIANKENLYGLGPVSFLRGEILIWDGQSYVSTVISDSIKVEESYETTSPFLAYVNVAKWKEIDLPDYISGIKDLEQYLNALLGTVKSPVPIILKGRVAQAKIHVQNLAEGSIVSSPAEAHKGQVDFELSDEEVQIFGFYSTSHQGILTHHDSFLHMHLINQDNSFMGHLDELAIGRLRLFLPE